MFKPDFSDLVDVFECSRDSMNPVELKNLYLAKVEAQCPPQMRRLNVTRPWTERRMYRCLSEADVLESPVLARFFKELFNHYFCDDLYGRLKDDASIILSSGSSRSPAFRLPSFMQWSLVAALKRGWYGYSDSRGRASAREALAVLENSRIGSELYSERNVCLSLGGTEAISSIADFLSFSKKYQGRALTIAPNYPPIVSSVADRFGINIAPIGLDSLNSDSLEPLIKKISHDTPLILLQTVLNPTGSRIPEKAIENVITAAPSGTFIVLDECHECFMANDNYISPLRARPNVIRIRSLSKEFFSPGLKTGWFTASSDFIDSYYEYASTHFGGPASINYLLLELLGWFEAWRLKGIKELSAKDIAYMSSVHELNASELCSLYKRHLFEREDSMLRVSSHLLVAQAGLDGIAKRVIKPDASINLLFEHASSEMSSYSLFLQHLRRDKVSFYPGTLCFLPNNGLLRLSPLIEMDELKSAFHRLSTL